MTLVDMALHINESNRNKVSFPLQTLQKEFICSELECVDILRGEPKEQKMTV